MTDYFGEREGRVVPRSEMEVDREFWGAFVAYLKALMANGSLAQRFPEECRDGGICGCDWSKARDAFIGEVRGIEWPLDPDVVPDTTDALEAAEFFFKHVSRPTVTSFHDFFRHEHFAVFDAAAAQKEYEAQINTLLRRNGHPFEMVEGRINRLGPPVVTEALRATVFRTGDPDLDEMLRSAREKFKERNPNIRRESLEELWDAWERIKTLEHPDKKTGITTLLDKAVTEPTLRARAEEEANTLTHMGNAFMIRHKEVGKAPIENEEHVDYLFHRMFAMIWMLLVRTGRAGRT